MESEGKTMKKNTLIALTCLIITFISSVYCFFPESEDNTAYIKDYIYNNIEYGLEDMHVIEEEDGTIKITATFEKNTPIDKFVPYTKDMIFVSEEAASAKNLTIEYVNTAMYMKGKTSDYFTYFGWRSDTGTLYTDDGDWIDDVDIDRIDSEVAMLFLEKEPDVKLKRSHANIEQIKISITNAIRLSIGNVIPSGTKGLSHIRIDEKEDWTLDISVSRLHKTIYDPVIPQFGRFVQQIMKAIDQSAEENEAVINLVMIGIYDYEDLPIVMWVTGDCETGILVDSRKDRDNEREYKNVTIEDIQSYFE